MFLIGVCVTEKTKIKLNIPVFALFNTIFMSTSKSIIVFIVQLFLEYL